MNRLEICVFGVGAGILAACSPPTPPLLIDASFYPGGKGVTVASCCLSAIPVEEEWSTRDLEDCEVLLADGSIVRRYGYCDDSTPAKTIKKTHPPKHPPKTPETKGKKNNGWGNGDQPAPGNSLAHNNAENNGRGKAHRKHGQARPD